MLEKLLKIAGGLLEVVDAGVAWIWVEETAEKSGLKLELLSNVTNRTQFLIIGPIFH